MRLLSWIMGAVILCTAGGIHAQDLPFSMHLTRKAHSFIQNEALFQKGAKAWYEQDWEKTRPIFLRLDRLGDPRAAYVIGKIHQQTDWFSHNPLKSYTYLQKALASGAFAAEPLYRDLRDQAIKVHKLDDAYAYAQKAAQSQSAPSLIALASFYQFGIGTDRNLAKASQILHSVFPSRENELTPEQREAGYESMVLVHMKIDRYVALEYAEKLMPFKNKNALLWRGILYGFGETIPRNERDAKQYLEIVRGLPDSRVHGAGLYYLGRLYERAGSSLQNEPLAYRYFQKALKAKYYPALVYLGEMTEHGRGVPADPYKASLFYTDCLELAPEIAHCAYNLGVLYKEGKGVDKNQNAFLRLMEMSAQQRHAKALMQLAHYYDFAPREKRNFAKARSYWQEACALGESYACKVVDSLQQK